MSPLERCRQYNRLANEADRLGAVELAKVRREQATAYLRMSVERPEPMLVVRNDRLTDTAYPCDTEPPQGPEAA